MAEVDATAEAVRRAGSTIECEAIEIAQDVLPHASSVTFL
jgi:hypothetical protein